MKRVTLRSSDVPFRNITALTLCFCDPVHPSALEPARVNSVLRNMLRPRPSLSSDGTAPGPSHVESRSACPVSGCWSTVLSGLIHDVTGVRTSFLFKAEYYPVVWMDPFLDPSICQWVRGDTLVVERPSW